MTAQRLDHCVIAVTDWERSIAFYRDVIGAEIVPIHPGRVSFRIGDTQLNVNGPGAMPADPASAARIPVQPGNSDLCFRWEGTVEDAVTHLAEHGVDLETGPTRRHGANGLGNSVYFRDPDGSLLEFIVYD